MSIRNQTLSKFEDKIVVPRLTQSCQTSARKYLIMQKAAGLALLVVYQASKVIIS